MMVTYTMGLAMTGEVSLESGYILKVEIKGFPEILDAGYEMKGVKEC